ncbi:unnamed protein product, partial [Adineta ricciae]
MILSKDLFYTKNCQYNPSDPVSGMDLTVNDTFAKHYLVKDYIIYKIPDNVIFEEGELIEPAAVQSSDLKL